MAFPQSFMDELVARSDIVDIVGSYVPLTAKGGSYWGCCPFHNEKTPSFHVLPDRQMYHCFGCKKGGSVINFIMEGETSPSPRRCAFWPSAPVWRFPRKMVTGRPAAGGSAFWI